MSARAWFSELKLDLIQNSVHLFDKLNRLFWVLFGRNAVGQFLQALLSIFEKHLHPAAIQQSSVVLMFLPLQHVVKLPDQRVNSLGVTALPLSPSRIYGPQQS